MATAFWTSSDSHVQPARETAVGRLPVGGAPQGAWPQGSVTETQSSLRLRPSHPALFGGDAAFGPRLETAAAPGAPLAPAQWPVPAQRPARTWERRILGARGSGRAACWFAEAAAVSRKPRARTTDVGCFTVPEGGSLKPRRPRGRLRAPRARDRRRLRRLGARGGDRRARGRWTLRTSSAEGSTPRR